MNGLRAFEAAARLGGFARAAEELGVSAGAVAQHVKSLEEWAGADLFQRLPQGLRLTQLGAECLGPLSRAFDQMGAAVQGLRSEAQPHAIKIAALPAIAQLWLAPRLPALREAVSDVVVSVTAMEAPPNLLRDPFDISLFLEEGEEGTEVDVVVPVCTPMVATRLTAVRDLEKEACLHDVNWSEDWSFWLQSVSPGESLALRGPEFSLYSLAVEEALAGAGVLLAHVPLVRQHLASGRLVAPFPQPVKTGKSIRMTLRPGPKSEALRQVSDFLSERRFQSDFDHVTE